VLRGKCYDVSLLQSSPHVVGEVFLVYDGRTKDFLRSFYSLEMAFGIRKCLQDGHNSLTLVIKRGDM
jgi:hypothetical protein